MQTFIPFKNFKKCAKCLDNKRLLKQIVEAFQILDCITLMNKKGYPIKNSIILPRYSHHPAVLMWIGHENALKFYISCMLNEWINVKNYSYKRKIGNIKKPIKKPHWINNTLIISHRSNLSSKSNHYTTLFISPNKIPYYWPYKWDKSSQQRIKISINEYYKQNP